MHFNCTSLDSPSFQPSIDDDLIIFKFVIWPLERKLSVPLKEVDQLGYLVKKIVTEFHSRAIEWHTVPCGIIPAIERMETLTLEVKTTNETKL